MPDESLPNGGPGRVYYEGAPGDFGLSELTAQADGAPPFQQGDGELRQRRQPRANAIDGKTDTIWSIDGGQGRYHTAVFALDQPLGTVRTCQRGDAVRALLQRRAGALPLLGDQRCRADRGERAAARDRRPADHSCRPAQSEDSASASIRSTSWSPPSWHAAHAEIDALRKSLRAFPTTLVMNERPAEHHRTTFMHNRGEYLQPTDAVTADVLSVLHPMPATARHDRLGFAQWLVDRANPLTARVTVNRQWAALFGRGLVRTVDDFGYQGDAPSNQALLDWLAVEFINQGWSLKTLHRLRSS
jgi:hypothetical protein